MLHTNMSEVDHGTLEAMLIQATSTAPAIDLSAASRDDLDKYAEAVTNVSTDNTEACKKTCGGCKG